MAIVTLAATQMACSWELDDNIQKAEELVTAAAEDGAQIILLQELFQTPYFCIEKDYGFQSHAKPLETDRAVQHFSALAAKLGLGHGVCLATARQAGHALREQTLVQAARHPLDRRVPLYMSCWLRNISRPPVAALWDWIEAQVDPACASV